jgi:hypothetical protein
MKFDDTFSLNEIAPKIFHVSVGKKDAYELAMLFLRYQEYYESDSKLYRNVPNVDILKYMNWYAKNRASKYGVFTYPVDWSGFNVPGRVFEELFEENLLLDSPVCTSLDMKMYSIVNYIQTILSERNGKDVDECYDFYLIGSKAASPATLKHELAHGLYYTTPEYKKEMLAVIKEMDKTVKADFKKWLRSIGYCKEVLDDEIQAYFSTGLSARYLNNIQAAKKETKPFESVFKKYAKQYIK